MVLDSVTAYAVGSTSASREGNCCTARVCGSDLSSFVLLDVFERCVELVVDEELPELELLVDEELPELELELPDDEEPLELDRLLDDDELLSESELELLDSIFEGFAVGTLVGERDACEAEEPFALSSTVSFNFGAARSTELVGAVSFN